MSVLLHLPLLLLLLHHALLQAALLWLLLPRRTLPWIALLRPALPRRSPAPGMPRLAPRPGPCLRAPAHVITGHPVPEAGRQADAPGGAEDSAADRTPTGGGTCGCVGTGACRATGYLDLIPILVLVLGLVPISSLTPVLGVVPVLGVPGAGDAVLFRLPQSLRAAAGLRALRVPRSVVRVRPTVARAVRVLVLRIRKFLRRPRLFGVSPLLGTRKTRGVARVSGGVRVVGAAAVLSVA
ncbi:MAG: hypothetical protein IRZ05_20645 [Micromonosporaceae bacterium]|nr:hypothetical protein [Micromonosporaceae bacterium]